MSAAYLIYLYGHPYITGWILTIVVTTAVSRAHVLKLYFISVPSLQAKLFIVLTAQGLS